MLPAQARATEKDIDAIADIGGHPTLALKEWSVTISALAAGEQTVLFRKGGIREPKFRPQSSEFLLFPTAFHTQADLLKPGVAERYQQELQLEPRQVPVLSLGTFARVTGAWTTLDPSVVSALDALHVCTQAFVDTRLKWRKSQPITVLELRAYTLPRPLQLPTREELWGCFSWVDLAEDLPPGGEILQGAVPALSDADFAARQAHLRQQLAGLQVEQLQL